MTYYISAKRFYFDHKVKEGGYLAVTDGRFGKWTEYVPEGAEVLDYSDYQIAPGLVDTHIHGFAGYDVMDNSEKSSRHESSLAFSRCDFFLTDSIDSAI